MTINASASAAGFGYQYERALHRIFHSSHPDTRFGIETADDIEEQFPLAGGMRVILEQDKLTTGVSHTLQDSSKNVWNTIRNWLKALPDTQAEFSAIEFVLVTNQIVPHTTLVSTLSNATSASSVAEAIKVLREHAKTISGAVADIASEVISHSDEDLGYVISRFHVVDGMDDITLKNAIFAALQFPEGMETHQQLVYDCLVGQLFADCQASWKKGIPFWTTAKPFFTRKHMLFDNFIAESWTPLTQEQTDFQQLIEDYGDLSLPFINQLRSINLRERTVHVELGHYWAAYSERTRLLKENRILPSDLFNAECELRDKWQANRDAHCVKTDKDPEDFNVEDFKAVYLQTSTPASFTLKMGRVTSNFRYLMLGTYHHQANGDDTDHPIHWHQSSERGV